MEITPKTKEAPVDLGPQDALLYFSSYREYEPENDLAYSDLEPRSNGGPAFVLPAYLSGSDYSGGSVTVSNHRLFIEEFGELEDVHNVYGGYGSYGVAIRLDVWRTAADGDCTWLGTDSETAKCYEDGPCPHQFREWLKSIEDYPVYDEEDMSKVEMEAQDEAWESWAESDFVRELEKSFPDDIDELEVTDSGKFRVWFEELRESANVYWENEEGNSAHVDIERVAAELEDIGAIVEASEETDSDNLPRYGFKLELLRRVSYLPYCQSCGVLITDEEIQSKGEALRRIRTQSGSPSHLKHARIALEKIVYGDSGSE